MQNLIDLLTAFLIGSTDVNVFEKTYLDLWRDVRDGKVTLENARATEILNELFYEVEAFTDDVELLEDPVLGKYNIGEPELKVSVENALAKLKSINLEN